MSKTVSFQIINNEQTPTHWYDLDLMCEEYYSIFGEAAKRFRRLETAV